MLKEEIYFHVSAASVAGTVHKTQSELAGFWQVTAVYFPPW